MSAPVQTSLAILMWSADLDAPQRVATPFVMAQAAAAMDMRVEMYFTAQTVRLLVPQSAGIKVGFGAELQTVGAYLQATRDSGVLMLACSQALHAQGLTRAELSPLCDGLGGAVQFMARCADAQWRTLVF